MNQIKLLIGLILLTMLSACTRIEGLGELSVYPSFMNEIKVVDIKGEKINIKSLNRHSIDVELEAGVHNGELFLVPGKNMEEVDLQIILDLPDLPTYELTIKLKKDRPAKKSKFQQHVTLFSERTPQYKL